MMLIIRTAPSNEKKNRFNQFAWFTFRINSPFKRESNRFSSNELEETESEILF